MTTPPDAKPSLAERIEAIAPLVPRPECETLRDIAAELREIAEVFRTEARLNYYAQVEDKIFNAWADRLARREP